MAIPKAKKDELSSVSRYFCARYKVGMMLEFYKEITVSAVDAEEAARIAEARIRARQTNLYNSGYSLGDIEPILIEEIEQ